MLLGDKMYSFQYIYLSALSVISLGAAVYDFFRTRICPPIQKQVVLTMDTLELVPFEGTQLQRVEDFDASKFHIKELRIKDLHKNLCKKSPYFRVRLDSQKRTSAAEPAERNGELRLRISDADYETCEEDGAARVPQGLLTLPNPSEAEGEISAAEEPPSNRTSKRKTRLPGKFRLDSNSFSDFPESYARYYRRSTSKSKVKHTRLKEKLDPVEAQFFEVPIEAHEVDLLQCDTAASSGERIALGSSKIANSNPYTPSERKEPTRPLKQIYHPPSSRQKRHPTRKQSRVTVDYSECMEVSTDTEPREGPRKTPVTSSTKWKHGSPDINTKEILPNGKRLTLDNGIKEKTRSSGSKVKERKSKPLESELQRTHNAQNGSTEILPVRWRLNSPDASLEEILPTERTRILESKLKENKRRTIESKLKEKKSMILERELKRSYYTPQASTEDTRPMRWKHKTSDPSTGKGTLESKSKDKKERTVESAGKETKIRTLEGESKRKHSASNASVEDILPMKWRRPKEKSAIESKWKEKINRNSQSQLKEKTRRTVDDGSNLGYRDRDGSTEKMVPLKRKHSSFDASIEEILPTEKRKTLDSKSKDKKDKTSEIKLKKARILKGELKQISNGPDAKDGKPARRVSIPIRKLKGGYASEDGSSDLERDTDGPGVSHPSFATEMKHSNVVKCFWMGIPADFSGRHMPDHDQFIVLQDAQGLKWETNYLARKKGLSGGWRRFALDHHLEMGDIVVFELVKPLKFLVHITKVSGGENATHAIHHPVRETPKKVLKPQGASVGTKRVSSLESALFSDRKRVNKDAEGKLPSKKPRLADGVKKGREGKERESVLRMPPAKPNRLFYPGAFKKKRRVARTATDHLGTQNAPLTFEDSEGDETPETKTVTSLSKFKHLSSADDDRRDSGAGMDLQELVLTVYEEPALVSSLEPQKAVPLSPKPGPKKKLRRVSYFYSTDEDQGNST